MVELVKCLQGTKSVSDCHNIVTATATISEKGV